VPGSCCDPLESPFLKIPMLKPRRGVLIVNSQEIGDVISSIPFIAAACRWADKQFDVYVAFASPAYFELVRAEIPEITPLYLGGPVIGTGLLGLCSRLRDKVDLVIGMPEIPEGKLLALTCALGARDLAAESDAKFRRWVSVAVPRDWSESFLTALDKIGRSLGLPTPLSPPQLSLKTEESIWAESILTAAGIAEHRPLVGLHCSANVPSKRWPSTNFATVVQLLKEKFPSLAVVSFGSEDERAESDKTRGSAGNVPWLDGMGWTLRESLAVLSRCSVLISGDTGVMHLAAAACVKTVSIFGPTSPVRRAPLHSGGAAAYPDVDCHPCYRGSWRKQCDCIHHVSPGVVADLAAECLGLSAPVTSESSGKTLVLR
jgi:heptosyltransferase II